MKNKEIVGYIYIMTNGAYILEDNQYKEIVKIGYTNKDRLSTRVEELSKATGVFDAFKVYAVYGVHKELADNDISEMLTKINPKIRYNPKREFYVMSPQTAYEIFECIAKINSLEENLIKEPLKGQLDKDNNSNTDVKGRTFHITNKGADAVCKQISDNKFILFKDSIISKEIAKSCPETAKRLRKKHTENGNIDGDFKITKDIEFHSKSGVLQFVIGGSISGSKMIKK